METIGDRLRKARRSVGLTQSELARRIGIRSQTVNQWESGKGRPSRDNLMRVAQITSAPTQWLLFGGPEPRKDASGRYISPGDRGRFVPMLSIASAIVRAEPEPDAPRLHTYFQCGDRAFFIVLTDNANSPEHPEGTAWVIDPDLPEKPGSMVLATCGTNSRPVLGRLHFETTAAGTVTIVTPLNSDYPAARSDIEPIEIIGPLAISLRGHF